VRVAAKPAASEEQTQYGPNDVIDFNAVRTPAGVAEFGAMTLVGTGREQGNMRLNSAREKKLDRRWMQKWKFECPLKSIHEVSIIRHAAGVIACTKGRLLNPLHISRN
jgi:hypothetical protein